MGYKKAEKILPNDVIELIQKYIDGEYIYIPRKDNNKKAWGSNTNTKKIIKSRNLDIYNDYLNGMKVSELAKKYFLSIKSIQKIIREIKNDKSVV